MPGTTSAMDCTRSVALAVVAENQDVGLDPVDLGILEQARADVVEGADDAGPGEDRGGLLGGGALLDLEGERPLLVEAERVDAVDDDLARELGGQRPQQLGVAVPRHHDEYDVRGRCGLGVRRAPHPSL